MKKINCFTLWFIFFLGFSLEAKDLVGEKLTWSKLDELEKKMERWSKQVGKDEMLTMGKMNQRPDEIEVIRAYFPYMLPQGFFSRKMDMSCFPAFDDYKKAPNVENYNAWQKCLRILYRQSMPKYLEKALQDLRPKA